MLNLTLVLILLSFISFSIFWQTRTIKRIVIEKGGNLILGCHAVFKETTSATQTNNCWKVEL